MSKIKIKVEIELLLLPGAITFQSTLLKLAMVWENERRRDTNELRRLMPFSSCPKLCFKAILSAMRLNYLTINEWGWVSYEELWRSRRVLSVEAVGRGGTHVQYTQTDTICQTDGQLVSMGRLQTDGPLVPMVRLVLIETDVIPMVLLVNVHLIKGT